MIRWTRIGRVLGLFLAAFGATMGIPAALSLATGGEDIAALGGAMAATIGAGGLLWGACRGDTRELRRSAKAFS